MPQETFTEFSPENEEIEDADASSYEDVCVELKHLMQKIVTHPLCNLRQSAR